MTDNKTETMFSADDPVLIDLDALNVNERNEVEYISGLSMDTLLDGKVPSGKMLLALIYVTARKRWPDITIEQAGEAKPYEYGWRTVDEGQGVTIPLQWARSQSPLNWAMWQRTLSLENAAAETDSGAETGETDEQQSANPT